jgi:hypothetical protein
VKTATIVFALVCVAGCVPLLPHNYYRPTASEGSNPRNHCWKTYEEIRFTEGANQLAVRIVRPDSARAFVEVALQLPAGHRARVARADFAMIDAGGVQRTLRFDGIAPTQMVDGARLPISDRMEGHTYATSPALIARNYWLYAPLELKDQETFTIRLPTIDLDDVPTTLPEIRFTRTIEVQPLAPLQC